MQVTFCFVQCAMCIVHVLKTLFIWLFTSRVLLAEGCDSPYLLGFLVELLQWRLEGEKDDAQVLLK